jgi:acetate kinase
VLRTRICEAFDWVGLDVDNDANHVHAATISAPTSRVRVAVEPTNEEWMVARHAVAVLRREDETARGHNHAFAEATSPS